jgi:hypothetical protein
MPNEDQFDEINPFLKPYRRLAAGWLLVALGHVAIGITPWLLGSALWKGLGLIQFAYVIPLRLRVKGSVSVGIRQAATATLLVWAFFALIAFMEVVGGGFC